jgi:hypothetical protein
MVSDRPDVSNTIFHGTSSMCKQYIEQVDCQGLFAPFVVSTIGVAQHMFCHVAISSAEILGNCIVICGFGGVGNVR